MNDRDNLTLEKLYDALLTARQVEERAKQALHDYAEWIATFQQKHSIGPGDFFIIDQETYDNLPFTPRWMKASKYLPSADEEPRGYISRRPDTWL
jgi:hypothetical protein